MEVDDLYHSNGFSNMEKYDEGGEPPISIASIDEIKETAAQLIGALVQEEYEQNEDFAESYRICFDENETYREKDRNEPNECRVVYFPTMHQGRTDQIPDVVAQSAHMLSRNIDPGESPSISTVNAPSLLVESSHMTAAMSSTRPSLSARERYDLEHLYAKFTKSRERGHMSEGSYYEGKPRATLS